MIVYSARFFHTPNYFQFYIQDASIDNSKYTDSVNFDIFEKTGLSCVDGLIMVATRSEFTEIPIEVALYDEKPVGCIDGEWDKIVECFLNIKSKYIVFVGCLDDPHLKNFGSIRVCEGGYRFRIYFGGQSVVYPDGGTGDFYAVEIWRSDEVGIKVIK